MGFASAYLDERVLFPEIIKEAPDNDTGIIVVVPAYNEPGITNLLDSMAICDEPVCRVEVLIVVNAPSDASPESIENNKLTIENIESWKIKNRNCFFRLFSFNVSDKSISGWGVGLARKTGMDEAVRRFNLIDKPNGVILNVDADCTVEKDYFSEVSTGLLDKKERSACSIYFEHPISGAAFSQTTYNYIILYELHLRFYYQGLALAGYPWVFHTVGSAIAVKAISYIKAGGMNRRRAGEDFYFIQKLVPAGGYFNLNSTTVYPSPRASFRVPFGTGASIRKLTEDNSSTLLTYNLQAFIELRSYFGILDSFYTSDSEVLHELYKSFPFGLKSFLNEEEWKEKMAELKNNTSGLPAFRKRFFAWFNMFKIVKYLNFVHSEIFAKKPVEISAADLLEHIGVKLVLHDPPDLLLYYRQMERTR